MSDASKEYTVYNRQIPTERKENGFIGILIPLEFMEFQQGTLTWIEMAVLAEIKYFCTVGKYKKCIVNNQHFMNMLGVSEKTVQRALSHLSVLNAITISGTGYKRTILFNSEAFEPKYSEIEYEDNLSDTPTICRDTPTICRDTPTYCQNSTLYENNKEENKEKAPAEPDAHLDDIKSAKHKKKVYREQRKLTHELSDGDRYIAEQLKAKKKSKSELEKEECLALFNRYDDNIRDLLIEYFSFASDRKQADSENKNKVTSKPSIWEGKLKKLDELVKEGYDCEKLIKQSLENKKYVFYPLESTRNNIQYNNQSNKFEQGNVIPTQMTHEEILAEKQRLLDAGAKIY